MRGDGFFCYVQGLKARGFYRDDVVDVLHFAFDEEIRIVENGGALSIENVGHDDRVRYAGFVFETQKDESLAGGAWNLLRGQVPF